MAIVRFSGFIVPKGVLTGNAGGPYTWNDPTLGDATMTYAIADSAVSAECEVKNTEPRNISVLNIWVYHIIRGVIDAVSFSRGIGLMLVIDQIILPDGIERKIAARNEVLERLCPISTEELIRMTERERPILPHLHDLARTLVYPLEAPINCARAVEGICRLISPDADKRQRWKLMQANLNLSRAYLKYITDASESRRHGGVEPQLLGELEELRQRAWNVTARFLEFRRRGNTRLPLPEFPLL